jgi:hypothetical protein
MLSLVARSGLVLTAFVSAKTLRGPEARLMFLVEVALWSLPTLLALALAMRTPVGARGAWWLVSAGCAMIVLDKCVDLQVPFYLAGKEMAHVLDPSLQMRGENLWMRYLLLGVLFLASCTAFFYGLRWDRELSSAKGVALLGLVMVMAYLGIRLLPAMAQYLTEPLRLTLEAICLCVVLAGLWMGSVATFRNSG